MNDMPIIPRGYTEEKIKQNALQYAQLQVYARHNAKPEVQEVNRELQALWQKSATFNQIQQPFDDETKRLRNENNQKINELNQKQQQNQLQLNAEVNREAEELTRREILAYRESRPGSGGGCDAVEELRGMIEELQGRIAELEGQLEDALNTAEDAQSAVDELQSRVDNLE